MKNQILFFTSFLFLFLAACTISEEAARTVQDFNRDWKFHLGEMENAQGIDLDDSDWKRLDVPHDWSIEEGYQQQNTGASTGFVPGGIGWYRKSFRLPKADQGKYVHILFDGIYNNSKVWINGVLLGERPNGYIAFGYDLTPHLKYGDEENVIAVRVDRTMYIDARWYTGSGIYRKVQLIKTSPLHVAQWGTQITTPEVTEDNATVAVRTRYVNNDKVKTSNITFQYSVMDANDEAVAMEVLTSSKDQNTASVEFRISNPKRWSVSHPNLYRLITKVLHNDQVVDETISTFGIRTFAFDSNEGFSLNGKRMKIKGVNLHHDAGAVGAAVPKAIWEYRVDQLKSVGVNAIRMAHNPHAKELLEVCDAKGMLVMNEAFDEWDRPKGKNLVYIGDNAAPANVSQAYPARFNEWAERDLKDLIRRDFNHPSVIMWSIGNEIEWTFPEYPKTYNDVNGAQEYYKYEPNYDPKPLKVALDKNTDGKDTLLLIAKQLTQWVKEMDTTRSVTCGAVQPSVGMASGYGSTVDVFGFNYRAIEYDAAHRQYPDLKIIGSENWGAYSEWKNCIERDFVAGIFLWTGFAYLGEAGPWPRKGLNISLFDYAGFKTPRGHFFETLWKDDPKIYVVTTPATESEFSLDENEGWTFDMQFTKPPVWNKLRLWEWYQVNEKWNYAENKPIIIQTYTNCEEAELFLNGKSLGKQKLTDFMDDHIIKWKIPYEAGTLQVVGYNDGQKVSSDELRTPMDFSKITLAANKTSLAADGYDAVVVTAKLQDANGTINIDEEKEITFEVEGAGKNIGIDNGWENNVQSHFSNSIITHHGKAMVIVQSTGEKGKVKVVAKADGKVSLPLEILVE
ncbi:MAG: sugar-binding domain-containing protein [Bacteroidota bacterium]